MSKNFHIPIYSDSFLLHPTHYGDFGGDEIAVRWIWKEWLWDSTKVQVDKVSKRSRGKRVKILVLNWILQHEGLRFSQDSFTLVLTYPLPGERSPMAVVDQVPRRWSGRQHLSLLLTALAWHPGFLWPWHTVADAVVAESTAAAAALGLSPLTLIWKPPMW